MKKRLLIIYDVLPGFMRNTILTRLFGLKIYTKELENWNSSGKFALEYAKSEIVEKVLESALAVKDNENYFERDSVILPKENVDWEFIAILFLCASKRNGVLNLIDFGGSLGSKYFENLSMLKFLKKVNWKIIEQKNFVELGNTFFKDNSLSFDIDLESVLIDKKKKNLWDLALFSSSLQYIENYVDILDKIDKSSINFLVIDRTPTFSRLQNGIFLQKVPSRIYEATYPSYVFSKKMLLEQISKSWNIIFVGKSTPIQNFTPRNEPVEWTRIFAVRK